MSLLQKTALALSCSLLLFCISATAQNASAMSPAVIAESHHDSSAPLRTMVLKAPRLQPTVVPGEFSEFREFSKPLKVVTVPDNALQNNSGAPVGTIAGLNFAGVGQGDYGYNVSFPAPDANGAVGATQYVQAVASSFAVFDKSNGALLVGPSSINSIFQGFGGACEISQAGDSVVVYDRLANRWIIGTMAQRLASGEGFAYECVAVSQTSDATGSYYRYALNMNAIDYQKIGVWPDGYYLGMNNPQNTTATVCALDRSAMLQGAAMKSVCFTRAGFNTLLPSDLDGRTLPPAGAPNYFIGGINQGKNVLNLFKFHADFANPKNSTLTGPIAIRVAPYTPSCLGSGPSYYRTCVPQKDSATKLETLSDRLMYRNAYRNFSDHESIVLNHSVDANGGAAVRWYELRAVENGNFTLFQQGTYAPDSSSRWMGSAAMDNAGNIALGYAISSSTRHPSVAYTGRLSTDPAGTMQGERIAFAGSGATTNTLWGDYSGMSIDPTDDCTFWYTSQYYKAGQQTGWSTRIASFKFAGCK
jgi:hypothetical protein